MNDEERKSLFEKFESVRPYLVDSSNLKEKMEKISSDSSDLEEVESKLKILISEEDDPSIKSDYRIFLNKLQAR